MPAGMRINGMTAPTSPLGHPDVLWGLPGQGGLLTEWAETVPDLTWPESVRTFGRMRRDARLTAVLAACFLPILRATWAVDPEGVDRSEAVDLVAADLGLPILGDKGRPKDAAIPGFKWHDHVRLALLSLVYGHMPFERWFEVRDGLTHLAGVQERQPHTIAMIDINDDGTVREVTQNTQNEPIPANRLLWYAHQREGANWAGVSLLRPCYTPWVLKHETMRVHATSIRRFGMGVPSVTAPPGATPGQIQQAQQLASQMRAGDTAGAGLPSGFTFQLTGMTGSAPDAAGFINLCNQEMTTSALTQMLELGQSAHGSRAVGESFLDLFLLSLQATADAMGDNATIGEPGMPGLAKSLVEFNWGEGEPVPRIVAQDVGDRHEVTAEAISAMLTAGAITADPNLEGYLREAWGLPERDPKFPVPPSVPPKAPPPVAPVPAGGGSTPPPASQPGKDAAPPASPASPAGDVPAKAPAPGKAPAKAGAPPVGLRRPLSAVEAKAGMEPLVIKAESDHAVTRLLRAWEPAARAMRQDLAEQVAAAVDDGNLHQLGALHADTGPAAAMLSTAMQQMAWTGAQRLVKEAAAQGMVIPLDKISIEDARLDKVAHVRAALIGGRLATEATKTALRVVQASAGTDAASSVNVVLDGLSPSPLAGQLAAAMNAAQNMGRVEAMTAGIQMGGDPTCFSSEILDRSTCGPCRSIDGRQFASVAEAEAAYINGGYLACEGLERCRGTIVVTWDSAAAAPTLTPVPNPVGEPGVGADLLAGGPDAAVPFDGLVTHDDTGDPALDAIFAAQGFNDLPAKGDLDAEVAAGGLRIWRGMAGPAGERGDAAEAIQAGYVDQFVNSLDRFIGQGIWANGDYFSTKRDIALNYADDAEAGLLTAVLRPGARIAADTDGAFMAEWRNYTGAHQGHPSLDDLGRYAAMRGYDAIRFSNRVVVLNRGAVMVEA